MKNIWLLILIKFEILSLANMAKFNIYKNQRVNNLIPLQTFTTTSPYYCLAMYAKYCTSTLMTAGVKACEIIKSDNGYVCNYYGSSFTISSLKSNSTSNVYVKQSGKSFSYKLFILFYSI